MPEPTSTTAAATLVSAPAAVSMLTAFGVNLGLRPDVLVAGYAMDVIAQLTIAAIVFGEPAPLRLEVRRRLVLFVHVPIPVVTGEWLVTDRLKRYIAKGEGWRAVKAEWICTNLLDFFDPTGNHC